MCTCKLFFLNVSVRRDIKCIVCECLFDIILILRKFQNEGTYCKRVLIDHCKNQGQTHPPGTFEWFIKDFWYKNVFLFVRGNCDFRMGVLTRFVGCSVELICNVSVALILPSLRNTTFCWNKWEGHAASNGNISFSTTKRDRKREPKHFTWIWDPFVTRYDEA